MNKLTEPNGAKCTLTILGNIAFQAEQIRDSLKKGSDENLEFGNDEIASRLSYEAREAEAFAQDAKNLAAVFRSLGNTADDGFNADFREIVFNSTLAFQYWASFEYKEVHPKEWEEIQNTSL